MSSKNLECSPEKEAKSPPLRRSQRLKSCSPTPSKVMTRSSTSEGSSHFLKLPTKRQLASELSPRERTLTRSLGKISSIQEEDSSAIENQEPVKGNTKSKLSLSKSVDKTITKTDTRTRKGSLSAEPTKEIQEENKTPHQITKSQNTKENLIETGRNLIVQLTPLKEVSLGITALSLTESKPQDASYGDESSAKLNQNMQTEYEATEAKSALSEDKSENVSFTKPESVSTSLSLDVAVGTSESLITTSLENSDQLNMSAPKNTQEDEPEDKSSQSFDGTTDFGSPKVDKPLLESDNSSILIKNSEENNKSTYLKSYQESNIDGKLDTLLKTHGMCNSEDEEDDQQISLLDDMAEEGEEDTPSEGSNDIIEVGEEINTTESELSTDESYSKDSFIDDEKHESLLSGDEYDLSLGSPKRTSRIIQLSSGSEDDIVIVHKKKIEVPKQRKKSRIITFSESSEEGTFSNEVIEDVEVADSKTNGDNNISIDEDGTEIRNHFGKTEQSQKDLTGIKPLIKEVKGETGEKGVLFLGKENENISFNRGLNKEATSVSAEEKAFVDLCLESFTDKVQSEQEILNTFNTSESADKTGRGTSENEEIIPNDKTQPKETSNTSSSPNKSYISASFGDEKKVTGSPKTSCDSDSHESRKQTTAILENISVKDAKDKRFSDQISELINSLCSEENNETQISVNISVQGIDHSLISEGVSEVQLKESCDGRNNSDINSVNIVQKSTPSPKNEVDGKSQHKLLKSKKKKRKRKAASTLSLEDNVDGKKKVKESINLEKKHVLEDFFDVDGIITEEAEIKTSKKKRKRKHPQKVCSIENENSDDEPVSIKKKKRKTLKDEVAEKVMSMNVVDEAVQEDKKNKLFLTPALSLNVDWKVKKRTLHPSLLLTQHVDKVEKKVVTCSTSESVNKFHVKDFKNSMFFDPNRVNRIHTKHMLKKKGLNS